MNEPPVYIATIFALTTGLTVFLFLRSTSDFKRIFLVVGGWLLLHGILAYNGFYQNIEAMPPRILLTFIPILLFILILFAVNKGRKWINRLDLGALTLVHIVRIPVELVLYGLFLHHQIPELMTFSGRNFDILAGITAPLVYYFGFVKNTMGKKVILFWNIACLGLLLNIVVNALLSAPLPFQQFAFDQPNIAITFFPFVWLPAVVVPLVLFSHLAALNRLMKIS